MADGSCGGGGDDDDGCGPLPQATVLITGFGPFANIQRNPSWEVAQRVQVSGVNIVREHLTVEYDAVDQCVPQLWSKYQPDLVIHCGVSGIADGLTIEKVAASTRYTRKDVKGCVPTATCGEEEEGKEEESLCTHLDVSGLVDHLNALRDSGQLTIATFASTNAGRYLCEYVYSRSLLICPGKTIFIHIPLESKFPVDESVRAVQHAIRYLLLKCSQ